MKRQASTRLIAVQAEQIRVGTRTRAQCEGDSGGAALMTLNGVEVLVGTDSEDAPDSACTGDLNTRVDANLDFIDKYIQLEDPGFLPASP